MKKLFHKHKVIVAGGIGNALEWFDFFLYGLVAAIIASHFFPAGESDFVKLLKAYGIFGLGFVARPFGAMFFGYIGDKFGRRYALSSSLLLMALMTLAIGVLPDYNHIGMAAPLLLVIFKFAQGFAMGGEFAGSITYIIEHAPRNRRATYGSASFITMMLGILLAGISVIVTRGIIGDDAFNEWGWRVPFLISVVVGIVGFYIRTFLGESAHFEEAKASGHISDNPVKELFNTHGRKLLIGMGVYLGVTLPFYMFTTYSLEVLKYSGLSAQMATVANNIAMVLTIPLFYYFAKICDAVGRKAMMRSAVFGYVLLMIAIMHLLVSGNPFMAVYGMIIFAVVLCLYMAPTPAFLVELFPTSVRYTGMALSLNLASILGGFTPMMAVALQEYFGIYSIAALIIIPMIVSFIALFFSAETYRTKLS